jgi:hypothetical protein
VWDERLAKHAPIVALSTALAATWAALREWRSSGRSQPRRTLLQRSHAALTQAVYAGLGAAISAGILEPLAAWSWAVAALGATTGVTVDVVSANGPSRIMDLSLRYLSRVRRILRGP